jgi:hypothetical protein
LSPPRLVYRPKKRGREKVKKIKRPRKAGLSPQEGDMRKKRKRPRMAGLLPQEGEKKKKEEKKTKEGEKVAPAKARFRVP